MGFGGISIWQLLIILAIVVLIFGTKKLKNMGSDVGGAVKNFKSAMDEDDKNDKDKDDDSQQRLSGEDEEQGKTSEKDSDKHQP